MDKRSSLPLPRSLMLKRSGEIRKVFSKGSKRSGETVNLFFRPSAEPKFAVIVPRRIGNAVKRNRMKRLAREVYRTHPEWFQNQTVIIFIKRFHSDYMALENEIGRLVKHR